MLQTVRSALFRQVRSHQCSSYVHRVYIYYVALQRKLITGMDAIVRKIKSMYFFSYWYIICIPPLKCTIFKRGAYVSQNIFRRALPRTPFPGGQAPGTPVLSPALIIVPPHLFSYTLTTDYIHDQPSLRLIINV